MLREIAAKFWDKWNFPSCLGAIDGKNITIVSPAHSGSLFFNYKRTFSIVLLALADAEYRFTYVQVGDFGRTSDGGVYSGSALGRGMENKILSVPADCPLPGFGCAGSNAIHHGRRCCISTEDKFDEAISWTSYPTLKKTI